jgi:LysM repeat protein
VYVVQRGDSLTGIADKFLVGTNTIFALNPQLTSSSVIRTGQVIYLGVGPFVRLDRCPNFEPCSLYEVQPGDSLAEIADRYGLTTERILARNPGMQRPIVAGQVIRLPHPA